MNSQEREWFVSRLNGYAMAMGFIDGLPHDSVAGAYTVDLDENDLLGSLRLHLQQAVENQYIYDSVTEIHEPWSRKLVVSLDAFFLQQPFGILADAQPRQVKSTREQMVTRIEDLIGLITDNYGCKKIYRVEMHSNDGRFGCMHVFPLGQKFLILKTISRHGAPAL